MITNLPEEILNNLQQYCNQKDWKCLMDTSQSSFEDLKYRTIHVSVSFRQLEDRVLPPIVAKLINQSKQLHLSLDTEDCLDEDGEGARVSWESSGNWRTQNMITHKDIKWFLSIPAQSINWYSAAALLNSDDSFMRALRKYEDVKLNLHPHDNQYVSYDQLNNSKRIKFLSITNGSGSKLPKLPSLLEFSLSNDAGDKADLTNLIYSLSLRKVTLDWCRNIIQISNQLKEQGVIANCLEKLDRGLLEIIAVNSNNEEIGERSDEENENDDMNSLYTKMRMVKMKIMTKMEMVTMKRDVKVK